MKFKKIIAITLILTMSFSLFACKKAETEETEPVEETTEETAEATPTPEPTATNTPTPTETPAPTPTPEPDYVGDGTSLEIYREFLDDYAESNPDATYAFGKVWRRSDYLASSYVLATFNEDVIEMYSIKMYSREVSKLFEISDNDFTADVTGGVFADLISDQKGYDSDSLFAQTTVEGMDAMVVKSEGFISLFVNEDSVEVKLTVGHGRYDVQSIDECEWLAELLWVNDNTASTGDGTYYGTVRHFSSTDSGVYLSVSEPIMWEDIEDCGYAPNGIYYLVYRGEKHYFYEFSDSVENFVGEYSDDFRNRTGYIECSSDTILRLDTVDYVYVPFAPNCTIEFNGPWNGLYDLESGDFDYELAGTVLDMSEENWADNPLWQEYSEISWDCLAEPVEIRGGQVTRIVLGIR